MPVAIVFHDDGTVPALFSEKSDKLLAARIGALPGAPPNADIASLRAWLASLPDPSGWFGSVEEAKAYVARVRAEHVMGKDELRSIREATGLSRAAFGEALGFGGNDNTRHKQVFEMESGAKPIMPERARRARALFAENELKQHPNVAG
ncbi:hypothetical protein [Acuticoccus sediminis]|nr:hypothetical protein [Acuticoccus sediminis]